MLMSQCFNVSVNIGLTIRVVQQLGQGGSWLSQLSLSTSLSTHVAQVEGPCISAGFNRQSGGLAGPL